MEKIKLIINKFRRKYSRFLDLIYPTIVSAEKKETLGKNTHLRTVIDKIKESKPDNQEILSDILAKFEKILHEEEERKKSIETRLTGIIGLSLLLVTISLSQVSHFISGTVVTKIMYIYIFFQLFCAIFAVISGLQRRGYYSFLIENHFPDDGLSHESYTRHTMGTLINMVKMCHYNTGQTYQKVTQMEVCFVALKNFIRGVGAFILYSAIFLEPTNSTENSVISLLSKLEKKFENM